jgi:F0F1-type ATP synthase assembly protein I
MPQPKKVDQAEVARASLELAFTVLGQIGVLTLAAVLGPLVLGLWLDKTLATRPLFTLLLLLASFPLTMYVIYRVSLRAITKIHAPKPDAGSATDEEDVTSDKKPTP